MKTHYYYKAFSVLLLLFSLHAKAQDTLVVNCGTATSSPDFFYQNNVYLDSSLVTYGIGQGIQPGLMVSVFDTNCVAWDTLPFSSSATIPFVLNSFKFLQDNPSHLNELDDLINTYIPNDHPFIIYTPMTYDGPAVAALSPQLAQTFMNYWGSEAVQTQSIMILFGIKGYPNSFVMDTLDTGVQFSFSTVICPHSEQTVSLETNASISAPITANPNPATGQMEIVFDEEYEFIEVTDLSGRSIRKYKTSSNSLVIQGLPDGQYLLYGIKDAQKSEPLRVQFY